MEISQILQTSICILKKWERQKRGGLCPFVMKNDEHFMQRCLKARNMDFKVKIQRSSKQKFSSHLCT